MTGCLFCKIAKKEISAYILYEDERTLSFLDVKPHSLGHTVVILKNHSKNILDTTDNDLAALFSAVKKTTGILQKSLNPDGFTIGINHGEVAGQAVGHLHIHIMPRYKDDDGGSIHSVIYNPSKKTVEEVEKIIKNSN